MLSWQRVSVELRRRSQAQSCVNNCERASCRRSGLSNCPSGSRKIDLPDELLRGRQRRAPAVELFVCRRMLSPESVPVLPRLPAIDQQVLQRRIRDALKLGAAKPGMATEQLRPRALASIKSLEGVPGLRAGAKSPVALESDALRQDAVSSLTRRGATGVVGRSRHDANATGTRAPRAHPCRARARC